MSTQDGKGCCLDIPPDHRLRPLFSVTELISKKSRTGGHLDTLRNFGQFIQQGSDLIDSAEIEFAVTLAKPEQ